MRSEPNDIDIRSDAASIRAGRGVTRHAAGSRLWAEGDGAHYVILLLSGRCHLTKKTAYGDYTVAELRAPFLVGASEVLLGEVRFASLEAVDEGESVRLDGNEVQELLFAGTPVAAAFRRLLILSATYAIRRINQSLGGFFSDPKHPEMVREAKASGTYSTLIVGHPADPERVRELFERSRLGRLPVLSQLGLVERTYPEGARLTRTGERATEAFLTYSGRVRISIKIPGVGEEALSILGPGEIVGEMGLVDGSVRSAYAIAHDGPVTVFVITRPVFRRLLTGDVDGSTLLVARIASSLAHRFEEAAARAVSFFLLSGGPASHPQAGGFEFDEDDVGGWFFSGT